MIREEGHIGALEGMVIIFVVLSAKLYLQYPAFLIEVAGPAAWQVALIVTGASLLWFLPICWLARRFPGATLTEIAAHTAGSFLATFLSLFVGLWLLATVIVTARNFAETFIIAILPNTPPSVLIGVAMLAVLYAAFRGIEPIGRAALILFPLILAGSLTVLIFSLPRVDTSRLFPFWGHGIPQTAFGGLWYMSMTAEAVALLCVGATFRKPRDLAYSGTLGILLFGLLLTITVIVLVGVFGPPDAAQQPFPMYNLARMVYLGRFLQRTEAVVVMFWVLAAAVRLSTLFHAAAVTLTGAVGLPYYRPLLFPLSVLVVTLALLPEDFLMVLRLDRDYNRPIGLIVMAVPLLLMLLAVVRKKGVTSHAA